MKEKIQKKLEENIERILKKEELSASDVAILEEKLSKLEYEEQKPKMNERLKTMVESVIE